MTSLAYFPSNTGAVYEETFYLMRTLKQLKQRKIVEILWSESSLSLLKKRQTSAIIGEISNSDLETGKNGPKSGVSRESWQH